MSASANHDESLRQLRAFTNALTAAVEGEDLERASKVAAALASVLKKPLSGISTIEGLALLEFARFSAVSHPEDSDAAMVAFRTAWPKASQAGVASIDIRCLRARAHASETLGSMSADQLMVFYSDNKDSTDVVGKVLAHEAASRAASVRPDTYSLSALASSIRHAPDIDRATRLMLAANMLDEHGERVGTPALTSIAAMLVDENCMATADVVLREVEARSPGNRNAQMVRARIASGKGDKIEAEHLASSAFRKSDGRPRPQGSRTSGFVADLADRIRATVSA